eukprot:14044935-Alexandrium_andersonii.AAC.1
MLDAINGSPAQFACVRKVLQNAPPGIFGDQCRGPFGVGQFKLERLKQVRVLRKALAERGRLPVSYTHLTLPTICSV